MTPLDGRIVLITGAAERAGAQIALAFAAAGATVFVNHLGQSAQARELADHADGVPGSGRVRPVEADIADPTASRAMVDAIVGEAGRIDLLLHNASSFRPRPFLELEVADVDASLGVNLRGPLFLSQAVAAVMMAQGDGRILAILGNSLSESWPELVPHVVGKSALGRLMEQLAVALSPIVACNSVAPTQFYRSDDGVNDDLRAARGETPVHGELSEVKGIPIRETALRDVIDVLLFLADAPRSLTGATIPVDGGRRLV
ncbi:SDR family NAD(P)-dependent oxidoreductase [Microbacterium sp.]|mgnify:CR=1 FL=1|uniref:SDR family NAD(P)-dependent oxidoreductase n=1 Tax=Microbacterium sp. TaxID=51671 RepID=UPI0009261A41|nr:SDR family NAD(P)-dependent oxidoreductase [Microbacterium sp.]MBN9193997.1 SDR family oxidoreductase [Microbacterium sp.]OJU57124.1 MAG: hypothetical protein BGO04_03860 [Microbacterium sp. 70-38]